MTGTNAATAYAALYSPPLAELTSRLPEIAEDLWARLHELSEAPHKESVDVLAMNLAGAHRLVLKIGEALVREGTGYAE